MSDSGDDELKAARAAQWDAQTARFDDRRRQQRHQREDADRQAIAEHAARRAADRRPSPRRELLAHAAPSPVDVTRINVEAMRIIPPWVLVPGD